MKFIYDSTIYITQSDSNEILNEKQYVVNVLKKKTLAIVLYGLKCTPFYYYGSSIRFSGKLQDYEKEIRELCMATNYYDALIK